MRKELQIAMQRVSSKDIVKARRYLRAEKRIAHDPGTPQWQVAHTLLSLAIPPCNSIEKFLDQAKGISVPESTEGIEAQNYIDIMLEVIKSGNYPEDPL